MGRLGYSIFFIPLADIFLELNDTDNQIFAKMLLSFGDMDMPEKRVRLKCQCGYEYEGDTDDAPAICPQCHKRLQ